MSTPIVFAGYFLIVLLGIGTYALIKGRRAVSESPRHFWRVVTLLVATALAAGLLTVATRQDDSGLEAWWLGRAAAAVGVGALGISVVIEAQRLAKRLSDLDSLVAEALRRIDDVDLDSLDLTARESEILEVIGSSTSIDDHTLAEALSISSHTVHTHVTNILRKARLRDRRDLQTLAHALKARRDAYSRFAK
ncbi:MAG TPA: LuxR C-terminal-related transcriptional regulator [Acidimicrobiia bacterium]